MAYLQLQGIEKFFGDHHAIKGIDLTIGLWQIDFVAFDCGARTH
jgi:multiple sugar transport system ATP-binding protein